MGHLRLCHITLQSCHTALIPFSPRACHNSALIPSQPDVLRFFIAFTASLTSSSKMFGSSSPFTSMVGTGSFISGVLLSLVQPLALCFPAVQDYFRIPHYNVPLSSSDLKHFLVYCTSLIAICVFLYFIAELVKLGFSVSTTALPD